ncbi:MAG: tRNA-specific 2-thiouridylase MnmA [Candidatus Anoxychlamydiales bacterium]|nr:tRNA-specific 2-thiouridylase MnmA [Candidatus Anoxychlamydiales bacterium]
MKKKVVAIGISGGVDSSVSAYLLKKQGYEVFALFMKNWQDENSTCSSQKDFEDVQKVCKTLDIPYHTINFEKEYFDQVFSKCLAEYKLGITPNPDILCNKEIKFNLFLKKAISLGADFLATGHYAQKKVIDDHLHLLKGVDLSKDQSYFLYTLKSEILKKVIFPIGHLTKKEVRKIAKDQNLSNHAKKDSTGICFIGKRKFTEFISKYIAHTPGDIRSVDGQILAKHIGLSFYTIGQRKGLKIGGKGDAWYVVKKDLKSNTLFVAQGENHKALFASKLVAKKLSLVVDSFSVKTPFKCLAKIRYRQNDQVCTIGKLEKDLLEVSFEKPQRAITEGQSIVFYKDNICLGGAIIVKVL